MLKSKDVSVKRKERKNANKEIKEAGFNHYKTVPIKDIYVGSNKYIGEVEQVVING